MAAGTHYSQLGIFETKHQMLHLGYAESVLASSHQLQSVNLLLLHSLTHHSQSPFFILQAMKAVKLLCAKLHVRYAMLAPVPRLAVSCFILQVMKAGGVGMRPGCLSLSLSVVCQSQ